MADCAGGIGAAFAGYLLAVVLFGFGGFVGRGGSTIDRYACCQAGEAEHRERRRAKVTSGAEGNCVRGAVRAVCVASSGLPPAAGEGGSGAVAMNGRGRACFPARHPGSELQPAADCHRPGIRDSCAR